MRKYYTRPCNFYYGNYAKDLIDQKKAYSLAGRTDISFDQVEILERKKKSITENFRLTFDVSIMSSLLVLLGYMLANDIKENPDILKLVPGLEEIISSRLTTLIFMATPFIVIKTSKCFLKTYNY